MPARLRAVALLLLLVASATAAGPPPACERSALAVALNIYEPNPCERIDEQVGRDGQERHHTDTTIDVAVDCTQRNVRVDWTTQYGVDEIVVRYKCSNFTGICTEHRGGFGRRRNGTLNFPVDFDGSCTYSGCILLNKENGDLLPTNFTGKSCARNSSSGNSPSTAMESSPVLLPTISQKVTHIYSTSATPQQEGFTTVSTLQQGMLATSLKPMTSRMSSISVSPTYSFDHLDSMASYTPSTHSIASEASFRQKASENSANINLLLNKVVAPVLVILPVTLLILSMVICLWYHYKKRMDFINRDSVRKFEDFSDSNLNFDASFLFENTSSDKMYTLSTSSSTLTLLEGLYSNHEEHKLEIPIYGTAREQLKQQRPQSLLLGRNKKMVKESAVTGNIQRSWSDAGCNIYVHECDMNRGEIPDHMHVNNSLTLTSELRQGRVEGGNEETPSSGSGCGSDRNVSIALYSDLEGEQLGCSSHTDESYVHYWVGSSLSGDCCNNNIASPCLGGEEGVMVNDVCMSPSLTSVDAGPT